MSVTAHKPSTGQYKWANVCNRLIRLIGKRITVSVLLLLLFVLAQTQTQTKLVLVSGHISHWADRLQSICVHSAECMHWPKLAESELFILQRSFLLFFLSLSLLLFRKTRSSARLKSEVNHTGEIGQNSNKRKLILATFLSAWRKRGRKRKRKKEKNAILVSATSGSSNSNAVASVR